MASRRRRSSVLLAVFAVLLAAACADGGEPTDTEAAAPTTSAPPTRVIGRAGGTTIVATRGPNSVLTAVVEIRSDEPVRPRLTARSGDHVVALPRPPAARRRVELALAGLRPERTYTLTLRGSAELRAASTGLSLTTGPLPGSLPEVQVRATPEARRGITLINASPTADDLALPGKLLGVDQDGEVVWYLEAQQNIADVRQLPSGNLLFNYGNVGAREVDLLGNLVREWTTPPRLAAGPTDESGREALGPAPIVVDASRLHHEVAELLPNGNFLALGMEIRDVAGFPAGVCGPEDPLPPGPRAVRGDVVLEFTPEGEIVHQVPLLDSLDPVAQPGVAMCETKTDDLVDPDPYVDWSHANSATLFEDQNAVLVSARNLNSVMALRWRDDAQGPAGEVLWQFGPGLDFRLQNGDWSYQQHAPEVQPDGTILVYDNGTERPGTTPAGGDLPPYSRAVLYDLARRGPPEAWTARQVWEHQATETGGEPTYADFLGDADAIGNGHVLVTHGSVVDPATDEYSARVIEVERAGGEIVFDLRVLVDERGGWRTYRAEHLDTLYPTDPAAFFPPDPPLP